MREDWARFVEGIGLFIMNVMIDTEDTIDFGAENT